MCELLKTVFRKNEIETTMICLICDPNNPLVDNCKNKNIDITVGEKYTLINVTDLLSGYIVEEIQNVEAITFERDGCQYTVTPIRIKQT